MLIPEPYPSLTLGETRETSTPRDDCKHTLGPVQADESGRYRLCTVEGCGYGEPR